MRMWRGMVCHGNVVVLDDISLLMLKLVALNTLGRVNFHGWNKNKNPKHMSTRRNGGFMPNNWETC